jgi:hypothetical protein
MGEPNRVFPVPVIVRTGIVILLSLSLAGCISALFPSACLGTVGNNQPRGTYYVSYFDSDGAHHTTMVGVDCTGTFTLGDCSQIDGPPMLTARAENGPDVVVRLTAPANVPAGTTTVPYTVTITNNSSTDTAHAVQLLLSEFQSSASPLLTYHLGANSGACSVDQTSQSVSCPPVDIGPGGIVTYSFSATFSSPSSFFSFSTTASASSSCDLVQDNNTSTVTTAVGNVADLVVAIQTRAASFVGSQLPQTITVTNKGPQAATGIQINIHIDPSQAFGNITTSQGTCGGFANNFVSCSLGQLTNGATATIVLTTVTTAEGTAVTSVQSTHSEADPTLDDDNAQATVQVSQ